MLNAGKALCRSGVGRITLADLYAMTLIRISESTIGSCDDRKERITSAMQKHFGILSY